MRRLGHTWDMDLGRTHVDVGGEHLDTVHLGVLAVDADGHDVLMNRRQRVNHELARPKDIADPNESQLLVF